MSTLNGFTIKGIFMQPIIHPFSSVILFWSETDVLWMNAKCIHFGWMLEACGHRRIWISQTQVIGLLGFTYKFANYQNIQEGFIEYESRSCLQLTANLPDQYNPKMVKTKQKNECSYFGYRTDKESIVLYTNFILFLHIFFCLFFFFVVWKTQ